MLFFSVGGPTAETSPVGAPGGGGPGAALAEFLRLLREYGQAGFRVLANQRIRFYGPVEAAKKPGTMAGARVVYEWNPTRGTERVWIETIDANGTVRSVRPETGGTKVHYLFDARGTYIGKR